MTTRKPKNNIGDYLSREFDRMELIGFKAEKIELCLSDIRRGVIEALFEARIFAANSPKSRSAAELSAHLDAWALLPRDVLPDE